MKPPYLAIPSAMPTLFTRLSTNSLNSMTMIEKKAEKRWIEKNPPHERTWATFQDWWTVEMRRQLKKSKSRKEAHEALLDRVSTVEAQMAVQHQAYQTELQSIQFQQALQASTPGSQQSIVDDSTVSDLTTEFQNMKMAFNSMIRDPGVCPTLPTISISTPSSTWESHHQRTERMQRYEACKKLIPDCH